MLDIVPVLFILYKRDPEINYKGRRGSESYTYIWGLYEMDPELKERGRGITSREK